MARRQDQESCVTVIIRRQWEEKTEEVQEANRTGRRRDPGGNQDRSRRKRTVVSKKLPINPWIQYLLFVIKNNSSLRIARS